jgi:hypothetical protein
MNEDPIVAETRENRGQTTFIFFLQHNRKTTRLDKKILAKNA